MLDFDYACRREQGSVACIVDPFGGAPRKDFYWGSKQVFIPSMFNPFFIVYVYYSVHSFSMSVVGRRGGLGAAADHVDPQRSPRPGARRLWRRQHERGTEVVVACCGAARVTAALGGLSQLGQQSPEQARVNNLPTI